jgi:hypothetical protein
MKKLGVLAVLLGIPATAMGFSFTEDFESYALSGPPNPTWYEPAGYAYLPVTSNANHTTGGDRSLLANNNYGTRKRGQTHEFGEVLTPSDDQPTILDYWIYAGHIPARRRGDVIVELSMGDVHAPEFGVVLPFPIPVIAYCKPYNDSTAVSYFNGKQWLNAGYIDDGAVWYNVNLTVKNSVVDLSLGSYGPYMGQAREYKGGFDRVSILYEGHTPDGHWYSVDDLTVTDVPEPATLALLSMGALFWRRCRPPLALM